MADDVQVYDGSGVQPVSHPPHGVCGEVYCVVLDNGESYADHSVTVVAAGQTITDAEILRDWIKTWAANCPKDYKVKHEYIANNPWPLGGQPPTEVFADHAFVRIEVLPLWKAAP